MMAHYKISIESTFASSQQIYEILNSSNELSSDSFEYFLLSDSERGSFQDPTVLVAIAAATSAAITALLNGIFTLLGRLKHPIRIVVEVDGTKVEIDGLESLSASKVLEIVNQLKTSQDASLRISEKPTEEK